MQYKKKKPTQLHTQLSRRPRNIQTLSTSKIRRIQIFITLEPRIRTRRRSRRNPAYILTIRRRRRTRPRPRTRDIQTLRLSMMAPRRRHARTRTAPSRRGRQRRRSRYRIWVQYASRSRYRRVRRSRRRWTFLAEPRTEWTAVLAGSSFGLDDARRTDRRQAAWRHATTRVERWFTGACAGLRSV
jgi:hypothetical protein